LANFNGALIHVVRSLSTRFRNRVGGVLNPNQEVSEPRDTLYSDVTGLEKVENGRSRPGKAS
jgi:hypothetical protein